MIIRIIGKQALRNPSKTDQMVMPTIETSANFSGTMPKAGVAKSANKMVTTSVIKALFHPDTLKPIMRIKSNAIGIAEISAAIGV